MKKILLLVFLVSFATSGCSVGMAMHGKSTPNLGAFRVGSTRGEVELQLGSPVSSTTKPDKTRVDSYEYEVGNDPSAGRAIGHGVMDVLTLGIWEVVGTPIEGVQGEKKALCITYDCNDIVLAINQSTLPKSEQKSQITIDKNGNPIKDQKDEAKTESGILANGKQEPKSP
jgi:hypothetical protein